MVSIAAFQAVDPGSIPGQRKALNNFFFLFRCKAEMFPSCTSLIRKLKNFSKSFDCNNIFPTILIGKSIGDTWKGIKKNDIYVLYKLLCDEK